MGCSPRCLHFTKKNVTNSSIDETVKYQIILITPCWQAEGERKGEVLLLLTSKGAIFCLFFLSQMQADSKHFKSKSQFGQLIKTTIKPNRK